MADQFFAHVYRQDNDNHVVIATSQRPKPDYFLCATPVSDASYRLAPHFDPVKAAAITCDRCSRSFVGFQDAIDMALTQQALQKGTA